MYYYKKVTQEEFRTGDYAGCAIYGWDAGGRVTSWIVVGMEARDGWEMLCSGNKETCETYQKWKKIAVEGYNQCGSGKKDDVYSGRPARGGYYPTFLHCWECDGTRKSKEEEEAEEAERRTGMAHQSAKYGLWH